MILFRKPVPTPDRVPGRVRGRLFRDHAPVVVRTNKNPARVAGPVDLRVCSVAISACAMLPAPRCGRGGYVTDSCVPQAWRGDNTGRREGQECSPDDTRAAGGNPGKVSRPNPRVRKEDPEWAGNPRPAVRASQALPTVIFSTPARRSNAHRPCA